jgi:hypothetical protein
VVQRNFHFGIDIPAAGWTPVYAVAPGTVLLEPDRVDVLTTGGDKRSNGFSYWHIYPAVDEHIFVRRHALLGWVNPAWAHLHFSEIEHDRWVNPLRPGALTPMSEPLRPSIRSILVAATSAGSDNPDGVRGKIVIVVDAYTVPTTPPPTPWQGAHLAPLLIRWRLLAGSSPLSAWRNAVDFRDFIPPNRIYHDVYAPGTRPNTPNHSGTYLFYLARNWNTDRLRPGRYTIQAEAFGARGAKATAATSLLVAAAPQVAPSAPAKR